MTEEHDFFLFESEFKSMKREGAGICSLCMFFTYGNADPNAENLYCPGCGNRSVMGIVKAVEKGVVVIKR